MRAHANLADNLAMYAAVIGLAHLSGATNDITLIAGMVLLVARVLHAMVYIAGVPYLRTGVFAIAQLAMLVYVWEIVARALAR